MKGRMQFSEQGKLIGVDNLDRYDMFSQGKSLKNVDKNSDSEYWSLYKYGKKLDPLRFSNGKTQEDVVMEITDLIKRGKKFIFLHGMCGTGKSAIALNIARVIGRTAIVVPVKNLQRQYEEDYSGKMQIFKKNGEPLNISMITGRENHDSVFFEGKNCNDPNLPELIQINEKNVEKLKGYYNMNPLINSKEIEDFRSLRRVSIAPANPYWSPIISAEYDVHLPDAVKKRYLGLRGREFIFYHRKKGCSYYDQFQKYLNSDVIIFNSAKYKIEVALDRKPETEVDIIDECDEFLDSFSNQIELDLTRLSNSLKQISAIDYEVRAILDSIQEMISLEEKRIRTVGINEEKIFQVLETNVGKILRLFLKNLNVASEISLDDLSYANKGVEAAKQFIDFLEDTYLTYRKEEDNLIVSLVTTNLSKRLNELLEKNKTFVFMSGTLHSKKVLEKIFGINDYIVVEAESHGHGTVDIIRTGKEIDCSYSNFKSGMFTRKRYLDALHECVLRADRPLLVHVQTFEDLPNEEEIVENEFHEIVSREKFWQIQMADKTGRLVSLFKNGTNKVLYSTKCSRGVDFPGDVCKTMIYTKYPNPNIQGTFWKILQKTHPNYFWDFYRDKAHREFLQRLFRALRFKEDHVFVLSPDSRVLNAVREWQLRKNSKI